MPTTRLRTFVCVVALSTATLTAQQSVRVPPPSTQQPIFKSAVELVQIDVVVVDKAGTPIPGLKAGDFTLLDRKKPQTIVAFSEESHERSSEVAATHAFPPTLKLDVADNQTVRDDRLIIMVADDLHIYKERTARAKDLTKQIINNLGAESSMALIFTSGEHSTQVTQDRSELLAAAETLKGRQPWPRPHQAIDKQGTGGIDFNGNTDAMLAAAHTASSASLQDFYDNMTEFKVLQDVAKLLGVDPARRKAFVLLSEGISKDLTGIFDGGMGDQTPCELAHTAVPCYHDIALRQMMESMQRSNVVTYSIDPRGKVSAQDLNRESFPSPPGMVGSAGGTANDDDSAFDWYNPVRQAQHSLTILSEASGGFAVTNTDDFTGGLSRIIDDLDHYYLMGFYPIDPNGKGYRPIDVKIANHPEWTVRFRRGYMPGGPPPGKVSNDPLVSLIEDIAPKTDLPLRLFAAALPPLPGQKLARVAVALEITAPTHDLMGSDAKLHEEVSYDVFVIDDKKQKVTSRSAHAARLVLTTTRPGAAMPEKVSYQVPLSFILAPGQYQLRGSATSSKLAKGGSVYLTIDVPDFTKDPVTLSGITVGYADGAHVPVGHIATTPAAGARGMPPGGARGRGMPPPMPVISLPFDPSLSREFASTDTMRIYFEVARKNPADAAEITVAMVDAADRIVTSSVHGEPAYATGHVDLRFPLTGLTPGPYRLRITATDGKFSTNRDVGIVIK